MEKRHISELFNFGKGIKMAHLSTVILMSLLLIACRTWESNKQMQDIDLESNQIFLKLIESHLVTIDDDFSAFLDSDTLYLLNVNPDKELSLPFQLHLITDKDSTISRILAPQDYVIQSELPETLNSIRFRKIPLIPKQIKAFRLGQYSEEAGVLQQKWQATLSVKQLIGNERQKCNKEASDRLRGLYNKIFQGHLKLGVFTEVPYDYYLLLFHKSCYIVSKKPGNTAPNMMLHFIMDKGEFDNYSFSFEKPSFEACLDQLEDLNITKINLSKPYYNYQRIRIGEYGREGNSWAQEYTIERLAENKLLRYEGQFN
ncbi:hypothetical protein LVD13_11670 [Flavobacteriaceae bacterium D16]|nr:hypothetical protein [Flavobacteriaceae bacterium D16]